MRYLVTGVAGFIGSSLAEELIKEENEVIGIDCFTDYYSKEIKEKNLEGLMGNPSFKFIEGNLLNINLEEIIKNIDYIFHEAAQPGVRTSWGENFKVYVDNNILATQKILEVLKNKKIKKFIFASSSSIYGDAEEFPIKESTLPKPVSPYGVTKLAAENLCYLYWKNYGIPIVSLRYFTVYGPRQRPDMAFHKFIKAILKDEKIVIYGEGEQTRDFTFIDDIVNASILAMKSNVVGEVFNIGGGTRITVKKVIEILQRIISKKAKIRFIEEQKGDVRHTFADISKVSKILSYYPEVKIEEGLKREVEWIKENMEEILKDKIL